MRRADKLRRNELLADSMIEQRRAEIAWGNCDDVNAALFFAYRDRIEQELDALIYKPPTLIGKLRNLGERMIAGFKKKHDAQPMDSLETSIK